MRDAGTGGFVDQPAGREAVEVEGPADRVMAAGRHKMRQKHAAAAARGITQNFVWRLGEEDERVWTLPSLGGAG